MRREGDDVLVVDGGNLFFPRRQLPKAEADLMMFKARVIVDAYNEIGVDAIALGPYDFAEGLDALRELERKAAFPFLCGNLLVRDSGQPIFRPYVILERAGRRIGVLGVLDSTAEIEGLAVHADAFRVEPMYSAVKRYAEELRGQGCELIVVLSAADPKRFRLVAKNVEGVQLYVTGDPDDKLRLPWRIGSAMVASSTQLGKYLGHVELTFESPGQGSPRLRHQFVAMKPDDPDDPAVRRIVDRYYKHVAVVRAQDPSRAVEDEEVRVNLKYGQSVYVGAAECSGCHPEAYVAWQDTPHARAYGDLPAPDRLRPECLECHVTGFDRWGGYAGADREPALTGVQCEACHGAGSLHPSKGLARVGEATAKACRGCHTRARSPGFRLKEALARIPCARLPGEAPVSRAPHARP